MIGKSHLRQFPFFLPSTPEQVYKLLTNILVGTYRKPSDAITKG